MFQGKNSQLHLIKRSIRNSLKTNLLSKILRLFSSRKKINNNIISSPLAEIETSDLIYVVVDISLRINNEYKKIINSLENKIEKQHVFLILNKIDKVKKDKVLSAIKFYSKEKIFNEIFPISSLTGEGVANLIKFSKKFTIKTSIKSKPSSNIQIKKKAILLRSNTRKNTR